MDYIIEGAPILIYNQQEINHEEKNIEKVLNNFITQKSPRTAIGIKPNGNWIFIFVNGYQSNYRGMTLQELTEFMKNLGCIYALNLSGGYTSSMFLNGKIINPFMSEIEHPISNAILVIPKN